MSLLGFLGALALTALLHGAGVGVWAGFAHFFDLFLVLALYSSLGRSANWSAGAGTFAGLTHDAVSGGLFGLHGFCNTLVAWLFARFQHRIVIQQPLTVGLLFALAAALQTLVMSILQLLLVAGPELPSLQVFGLRMVTTGILGGGAWIVERRIRGLERQWREQRGRRLRLDTPKEGRR